MSYCRTGKNSDVYMYRDSSSGLVTCCACRLQERRNNFATEWDALHHLYDHRLAGHKVPQRAITRLLYEAAMVKMQDEFDGELKQIRDALVELTVYCLDGRRYETCYSYCVPEIKVALEVLGVESLCELREQLND